MAERDGLTKAQIISELTKSPHGKLAEYLDRGVIAAMTDPDFFGHLIAWNRIKGQIRDAKVALPVIALKCALQDPKDGVDASRPYADNALAHLALLDPRSLVRALDFAKDIKAPSRVLQRFVARYLAEKEQFTQRFDRAALQHRKSLVTLYARYHVKPGNRASDVLFRNVPPDGSLTLLVHQLQYMDAAEIANAIERHKLPFLVVRGALGKRAQEPDVLQALIARMSPAELVTNMKALERLGVRKVPQLRASLEAALGRASTSPAKRGGTLKATRAAEALEQQADAEDDVLAAKLRGLQERQLETMRSIDGHWLVLADKSSSMHASMEIARQVAGILTRMVKGTVHLVFFNESPTYFNVTGMPYDAIKALTAGQRASGNTGIGCGVQYAIDRKFELDGIAIISDGGENRHPDFCSAYRNYERFMDRQPTVYLYHVPGDTNALAVNARRTGLDITTFEVAANVDYYALMNLVQTMRIGRYQLLDEIQATRLLTLDAVLDGTQGMPVLPRLTVTAVA